MSATREPMSVIDAAWLRMDRPTNLMMICGVMLFDGMLDLAEVRDTLNKRLLCFHRFRQRVVRDGRPGWEEDPYFDIGWHLRHIALPAGMRLEDMASELASTPLDPGKPMWQYHLIDTNDGNCALFLRIHHCYADGFAMMHVVSSLTDAAPDKRAAPSMDVGQEEDERSAWERIFGPVTETVGDAIRKAESLAGAGMAMMFNPMQTMHYGLVATGLVQETAVIATMTPDSPTRFKGQLGVMKRVAWAPTMSLKEVKALAAAFSCSVNDVLLACVSGALRNYLEEQGDVVDDIDMRALVPVNLREPGRLDDLGNCFGMVFFDLPLGIADPYARVLEVHKRMNALKHSQQPRVALGILAGMGVLPEATKERVLEALAANASAVITNVRGFDEQRYFAGRAIAKQVFWVPQSGGIGLGISILSYAGGVDIGVMADTKRVANPGDLAACLQTEFESMLYGALLAQWPDEAQRAAA